MALFDVTQIALERAIAGASARQGALASNIANANTPGYVRSDVDFHSALARELSSDDAARGVDSLAFAPQKDRRGAARADGNNVDVDSEMSAMAQNSLEYGTLVSLARVRMQMIQNVLGTR